MLVSEEELTVEIAQVNCIQVNYVNLAEATQYQVFEEFTSYPSSSHE